MLDGAIADADEGLQRRSPLRLKGFDYRRAGAYFVTIGVEDRAPLLGTVEGDRLRPSAAGELVAVEWRRVPVRFQGVRLDRWVVMPDHLHGILWLEDVAARTAGLSEVIGAFKSLSARACREFLPCGRLWQRSFHDHVIRDEESLASIRKYIDENPLRWTMRRRGIWP